MGLLQKLKSALGLDGTGSPEAGTTGPRDVDVTVEREPSSESEDAVKGTETAASGTGTEPDDGMADVAEPAVEDESAADVESTSDVETAGGGAQTVAGDEPAAGDESTEAGDADVTEPADEGSSDPVTEINGIGPAYGQRLESAGVETVADLAAADADELEAATDISANRIAGWIDAAAEY